MKFSAVARLLPALLALNRKSSRSTSPAALRRRPSSPTLHPASSRSFMAARRLPRVFSRSSSETCGTQGSSVNIASGTTSPREVRKFSSSPSGTPLASRSVPVEKDRCWA